MYILFAANNAQGAKENSLELSHISDMSLANLQQALLALAPWGGG